MPARNVSRSVKASPVIFALAAVALTACASEPAPEPVKLTVTEAAAAYLGAVCPVNDAWDDLDFAVDQLRLTLDASGGNTEESPAADAVARFTLALKSLGADSESAADALEDPDQVWPKGTPALMRQVVSGLRADTAEVKKVAKLKPAAAAAVTWPSAAESTEVAAATRKALGLPEDSAAACAERPAPEPEPAVKPTPSEGATP